MRTFSFIFLFIFCKTVLSQALIINEIDPDSPGVDTKEFIELKSVTPNFSTDGYILVFFNGSTDGGDSSYLKIDLQGFETDINGLLVMGAPEVTPYPQVVISENNIQNGADAVGIYFASEADFPAGTLATQTNLIDAMVYGTNDSEDTTLLTLLGQTEQYNDNGTTANPKSIQRFVDTMGVITFTAEIPTPRRENDASGIQVNPITISVASTAYTEGETFDITFTAETNVTSDLNFSVSLSNSGFNTSDYSGNLNLTIPSGQNSTSTTITTTDDTDDEGDEVIKITFLNLVEPVIPFNNNVEIRLVDNDFTIAPWGTPINPTNGIVQGTQPFDYYNSLNGLANTALRQALQDIIANPTTVRAQTYADGIDILKIADQNPENSNEVWLVYSEEGRSKLEFQTGSNSAGKWNREHTFPRSRGGFFSIDDDDIPNGIDIFWTTKADSLRHGNSDAHALRASDASENSTRSNKHYGDYNGPTGNLASFKGDVARSVLYMEIRYNGLQIVNGFPSLENPTTGDLGDLATLLDWHRNDPPDDFEMNRNNIVYQWQKNRNPFIDHPLLVEYIWGLHIGDVWNQTLSDSSVIFQDIKMFPNPAKSKLFISGLKEAITIEVYSIEGKLLKTYTNILNEVDLDLKAGIYYLKLKRKNQTLTKKVILI